MTRRRDEQWDLAATARRVGRVIVAMIAAYELRNLVASAERLGHTHLAATVAVGSTAFWVTVALASGFGLLLREMTRGLPVPHPDRSGRLAARWACCSAALLGVLCARGLGSAGLGAVAPTIAGALSVGLLLAVSLEGSRWVLHVAARLRPRAPALRADTPITIGGGVRALPPPAPLLAGWSDRGPPMSLA